MNAAVSVVVVSDYEDDAQSLWRSARSVLAALARQDFREAFEVIFVESERFRDETPPDLREICPRLRIVYSPDTRSARLKDFGVSLADAELVAVLEADCLPNPSWLRLLVDVLRQRPEVSAASGRTSYGDETTYRRALSLVDRSFDDLGRPGVTDHVSNNGALYRRSLLRRFPYPETISPFTSASLRMRTMRQAGEVFFFEPGAVMRHAIGGWRFVRDFRRQTGYCAMFVRETRKLRAIPTVLWRRRCAEIHDCFRLGSTYLRWYDWPLTAGLLAAAPLLELPGMLDALRERAAIPGTSYR